MASWHKKARLGVAVFGLAVGAIVYAAMGERQPVLPRTIVERTDPKAIFESKGNDFVRTLPESISRMLEIRQVDSFRAYEDGSLRLFGVKEVIVRRGDKEYTVSGREGYVGPDSKEMEITGEVRLLASDGFELKTDRATFSETDGAYRAHGNVIFGKGRMSGSGRNIAWEQTTEVLTIGEEAFIVTRDNAGNPLTELTAASASLDRMQDLLLLHDGAHIVRDGQVIDAREVVAQLSETEDVVRHLKLIGDARVAGAASIDAMSARDIELDYTDDGRTLEAVTLRGTGAIAMAGQDGAPGRQIRGDSLDLRLAPDGSVVRAVGKGNVQLELPPAANGPPRSIRSNTLDARGQAGRGLTDATFTGDVSFTEDATRGAARRAARSQALTAALSNDAVTSATFTGRASFEEQGLIAGAARLEYRPNSGTLELSGMEGTALPCAANEKVSVAAQTINVALERQSFTAKGDVNTTMRGGSRGTVTCAGRTLAVAPSSKDDGSSKLPGLLDQNDSVIVNADTLEHQGEGGRVVYSGTKSRPTMVQGKTSVRADNITIDQATGDFTATGLATANIVMDAEEMQGQANEIKFVDARRQITFSADTPARGGSPAAAATARLQSAQRDLRANRIDVVLGKADNSVERIEARGDVSIRLDTRSVTYGDLLTYHSAEQRYQVTAKATRPLVLFQRDGNECRENTGLTLTFFKDVNAGVILDSRNLRRYDTRPKACS